MKSYNVISTILCLVFLSINVNFGQVDLPEINTVQSVDLERYAGTWYEISKIPNSFQDHCYKNGTATYNINKDGTITVINKCVEEDGEEDIAEGVAQVVDSQTNSKLEVSFVSLFGINLFWGDYWIIGLEENYQYVIVGTPDRKYGWILGREPRMSDKDYEMCENILKSNGYDPKIFIMSLQEY